MPYSFMKRILLNIVHEMMEQCTHVVDWHIIMILSAVKYLADIGCFNRRVLFIFQQNEEQGIGAKAMIEDGLFDCFDIEEVFSINNLPGMLVLNILMCLWTITASESLSKINIKAKGGHSTSSILGLMPL